MRANKYGRIVNIASIAGKEASEYDRLLSHEGRSDRLTKSLGKEVGRRIFA